MSMQMLQMMVAPVIGSTASGLIGSLDEVSETTSSGPLATSPDIVGHFETNELMNI